MTNNINNKTLLKIPVKPTPPPIRRIVNEKVINQKEIDDWSRNRKS